MYVMLIIATKSAALTNTTSYTGIGSVLVSGYFIFQAAHISSRHRLFQTYVDTNTITLQLVAVMITKAKFSLPML